METGYLPAVPGEREVVYGDICGGVEAIVAIQVFATANGHLDLINLAEWLKVHGRP